ncbi:MAG: hydantoinase/oxoprolinase family protein [Burkholderiales bacterium]
MGGDSEAMNVLGWDIGGAHLKAALVSRGKVSRVWQLPCPLWINLKALIDGIAVIAAEAGAVDLHALTMTGEVADVFANRQEGVETLLAVFAQTLPKARTRVYAHPQKFLSPSAAKKQAEKVASANWSASAAWAANRCPDGLLVDIGSTTTDIIPIAWGKIASRGVTDSQRLAREELVYTGVVRTPVMAMAERVPFAGEWRAPMAEYFATSADVYRLTRELPEDADQMPTADGRGKTRAESARRLGRMIGVDATSAAMMEPLARYLARAQLWSVQRACARVVSSVRLAERAPVIGAGAGQFVARKLAHSLGRPFKTLDSLVPVSGTDPRWVSNCAPAVCVALLAAHVDRKARR